MPDSLRSAVRTLLSYANNRDSILIYIDDVHGGKIPFWLTAGKSDLYRYWLKNSENDSITIWMGNPSKHDLTLMLEEDVNVKRLEKEPVNVPIIIKQPDITLLRVKPLEEIPVYWDYAFSTAFAMNQTYLAHWSKGGENSLSSGLDMNAGAKYVNNEAKTQWINTGTVAVREYHHAGERHPNQ